MTEYLLSNEEKPSIINIKEIEVILQKLKTYISNLFKKILNTNGGTDREITKGGKIMCEIKE